MCVCERECVCRCSRCIVFMILYTNEFRHSMMQFFSYRVYYLQRFFLSFDLIFSVWYYVHFATYIYFWGRERIVVIKCFMIAVNVWWVYLAPRTIPRAISVLTLGNKVILYCCIVFLGRDRIKQHLISRTRWNQAIWILRISMSPSSTRISWPHTRTR